MFCSKCGFQNNPGETICRQCGTALENNNQQMNNYPNQQNVNTNTPNMNNNTYRLTLTRPKEFVGSLIKFKIFIDNNEVGTIKNGETVVLNVSPGNHTISFNKTMVQNINISSNITADVVVIASNQFGLSNIRDNNGLNIQNNELYAESSDKIIKSAKIPLQISIAWLVISFIMLFTVKMVVSPWMYGIPIGYTIINLSSLKKHKQILNNKYNSLVTSNIISIVISIIGAIVSGYLILG